MTIPDFQTIIRPILAFLAHGQSRSKGVIAAMSTSAPSPTKNARSSFPAVANDGSTTRSTHP